MEAVAADLDRKIAQLEGVLSSATIHLQDLHNAEQNLRAEANLLQDVIEKGVEGAIPTPEEDEQLAALYERLGQLRAELAAAQKRAGALTSESGEADMQAKVAEKIRTVLAEEAQKLNKDVLEGLSIRTGEMANRIGAESISDVECSPYGTVKLRKHGVEVRFTTIQNPGDRLRVKLAFFLAMMCISRESGAGRHPGLLLIDQLGSAEMVEA
ncbi:MAG: hypothetical protein JWL77_6776, partial [Chthonomonadaceae bacterium]|nr:hypothetical protein [Chthonomonadaceae bacterium]